MSQDPLPSQARVVIVGGGIAGCSVAYHLASMGCVDVVLLEQGQLTCGTTWHAAGLVGQMRPNRNMTRMSKYGIELYSRLEAETGLATGWKACGSVNVAQTPQRMKVLRRQIALARSFGVEVHEISPREVAERAPGLRTDDLQGGIWIPGDGKANPADLTMSLAKGARQKGVRIVEGAQVIAVEQAGGRVSGLRWLKDGQEHHMTCEVLVNCAGQWARQFGALAGVNVPLYSAEHFYIVTGKIEGIHPMWPVVRDPDGFIYYKEEVGGLVMGGFEPVAKPWRVDPIPASFQFQLLDEDWDQFEILMQNALRRTPSLEQAEIKMLLNGPESFTPDGNFILGQAPELGQYFVCAGFNSAGIANSGGAGRLMAEWILGGEPSVDLSDVDIRRFAAFTGNRRALAERTGETLGLHYAMRWPRQELQTARPLRTSPLYDGLASKGAVFGSKNGWERVNYFKPAHAPAARETLDLPDWLPWVHDEQRATREAVAIYDQSSFSKLLVQGRDALSMLQRLCPAEIDVPVGKMVYTPLLNERGGCESDLTVMRLAVDRFMIVTGSAQGTRDMNWLQRHRLEHEWVSLDDVTAQTCVLSLMGPNSKPLMQRVSPDDVSNLPFAMTREIDLGFARVRIARMSYVGGPGYELYVPVEMTRHVYQVLQDAGASLGLRDAGYYALDALRIERLRRAWGAELGPDETPIEAGMLRGLKVDKPTGFIGQAALRQRLQADTPPAKKLVRLRCLDRSVYLWGGEPLMVDGQALGEITSAGWGWEADACVALAYVRGHWASQALGQLHAHADLWGKPVPVLIEDL